MTMITPSYLGETIEYSSLHACRSTLEDPTEPRRMVHRRLHRAIATFGRPLWIGPTCGVACQARARPR